MTNGARFTSAQDALSYILSGRAVVTLVSRRTAARFTYEVERAKDDDAKHLHARLYFVRVLTGPDNTDDYTYLGVITLGTPARFRQTANSHVSPDAPSALAFAWTFRHIAPGAGPGYGELPKDLEVWHEGTCGRCGRRLTTPESIASGIGPECRRKKGASCL